MTRTQPILAVRIVVVWLAIAISINTGCHKPAPKPGSSGQSGPHPGESAHQDELYEIAIETLNRLEEFDGLEMLQQSVNRLDRWVAQQPPPDDWQPDPFVTRLREDSLSLAAGVREGASELAKLAEIDDPAAAVSRLGKASRHFKDVSRQSKDMGEASHVSRFLQLAADMDKLSEQLKALASSAEGDNPQQALQEVKAYIGPLMSGSELVGRWLDEFARQIDLEDLDFPPSAATTLREAVWFRNVSRWVVGDDRGDPLRSAIRLFDWTVRNIQLENALPSQDGSGVVLQYAWETLLFGRGLVRDRAWTFMILARQQRLDAALLATVDPEDPDKRRLKPLGIGVAVDGEVYVFDPRLGVPIPGADGVRLDDEGLTIHPATLSQLAADDSLLRQMDLDADHPHNLRSADFQKVVVLMETSPSYLTKRMKLVESRLSGEDRLVLTAAPDEQAAVFQLSPQVVEVRHWEAPYQTILQTLELGGERLRWQSAQLLPFYPGSNSTSPLWKGRMYHFSGVFSGDPNAVIFYQSVRRSQRELDSARHRLDQQSQLEGTDPNQLRMGSDMVRLFERVKMDAGYWLGLIHAHQGNSRSAIDYFEKRTIGAFPGGPWTHGAVYNLARVFEAEKQFPQAIGLYRLDGTSPCREGNLLRAVWLERLAKPEGTTAPAEDADAETKKTEETQ